MSQKRVLFLHYHQYKNAGTSIDELFYRNPGGSTHFEASDPDHSIETDELVRYIRANPKLGQITSPGIKPPRPHMEDCYVVDIVFFRHPVDRFRSIYDYNRAERREGPIEQAAKRLSLAEFAAWMARETPHNFFSPQTTVMGCHGEFFHPPTHADLERAKERVLQVRMLGTVELYDESLFTAGRFLRSIAPQIDFRPKTHANASENREQSLEDRIARVRTELGEQRYAWLLESLQEDMELWRFATAEVRRRHRLAQLWVSEEAAEEEAPAIRLAAG